MNKKSPKRGRPVSPHPKMDVRIQFMATPELASSYRDAAHSEGMHLAEWIRFQLQKRVDELKKGLK